MKGDPPLPLLSSVCIPLSISHDVQLRRLLCCFLHPPPPFLSPFSCFKFGASEVGVTATFHFQLALQSPQAVSCTCPPPPRSNSQTQLGCHFFFPPQKPNTPCISRAPSLSPAPNSPHPSHLLLLFWHVTLTPVPAVCFPAPVPLLPQCLLRGKPFPPWPQATSCPSTLTPKTTSSRKTSLILLPISTGGNHMLSELPQRLILTPVMAFVTRGKGSPDVFVLCP